MTMTAINSTSLEKTTYQNKITQKPDTFRLQDVIEDEDKVVTSAKEPTTTNETEDTKVNPDDKKISKALKERNEKLAQERMNDLNRQNIGLAFSFDKDTDNTIVKVTDLNTEKLVRQIPSEEFLELSKRLNEYQQNNQVTAQSKEKFAKGLFLDDIVYSHKLSFLGELCSHIFNFFFSLSLKSVIISFYLALMKKCGIGDT